METESQWESKLAGFCADGAAMPSSKASSPASVKDPP